MNPARRSALGLAAGMGLAAAAAQWAKPVPDPQASKAPRLDALLPVQVGDWRADPGAELLVKPPSRDGRVHGIYDQVLERTYVDPQGRRLMLLAAQGSEQSAGLQLHRPEVCYPSNGFKVQALERVVLRPQGHPLPGTRLHATLPGRSEPITYWMLLGGEPVADSTDFRLRQIRLGLRRRLAEGLLVRLSSIDTDAAAAYAQHVRFADVLAAALPAQARARLMGI